MYTKEQIETALKEFERLGSVQATITLLGYPSSSSLYKWYERKLANKKNYHGSPQKHCTLIVLSKRNRHSAVIGIKFKMSVIMILKNARHFKMISIF